MAVWWSAKTARGRPVPTVGYSLPTMPLANPPHDLSRRRAATLLARLDSHPLGRRLVEEAAKLVASGEFAVADLPARAPALVLAPLERDALRCFQEGGAHLTVETLAVLVLLSSGPITEPAPPPVPLPRPLTGEGGLRVLVTGSTGFLGGVLARRLLAAGATVTATGRRAAEGAALAAAGAHFVCADLSDETVA